MPMRMSPEPQLRTADLDSIYLCAHAPQLVSFMYTSAVDASDIDALISLLRLADRLLVPRCCAAAGSALAALTPDAVTHDQAAALLGYLPASVAACGEARQLCVRKLMQRFGDAALVLVDAERGDAWLALPYAALLALLASDELQTDSENNVLLLLVRWLLGPGGGGISAKQRRKLCAQIRLPCLGQGFLNAVLPQLQARGLFDINLHEYSFLSLAAVMENWHEVVR